MAECAHLLSPPSGVIEYVLVVRCGRCVFSMSLRRSFEFRSLFLSTLLYLAVDVGIEAS